MQTKLAVIEKKTSYQVPVGKHRGVFSTGYRPKDKKRGRNNDNCVKLGFKLPALSTAVKPVMAARTYDLSKPSGSSFKDVAAILIGREVTEEELKNPYLLLKRAIGKEVDLSIVHRQLSGYADPLVCIKEIQPAGTWVKDNKGEFVDAAMGI